MNEARPAAAARPSRTWSDLGPRLISAAVLIALTALALWLGGYVFAALVGAAFAGAYREWEQVVTLRPLTPFGGVLIGAVALSAIIHPLLGGLGTMGVITAAAVASLFGERDSALWRVGGLLFFGVVILSALSIRGTSEEGVLACVFLGAVVWLTDTGAFFAGRQVGGEKLAPDISPSKTWSGALGGFALAVVAGTLLWVLITDSPLWIGILLAALLSVVGQIGDLTESALKRRFRVKDSGDIIPGHGGLMDRLDSVSFGVILLFLIGALHGGLGAVASGLLNW